MEIVIDGNFEEKSLALAAILTATWRATVNPNAASGAALNCSASLAALPLDPVSANNTAVPAQFTFLTGSSVLFDAVYVPGGAQSVNALLAEADAIHFINEAYKHCKPIAASDEGVDLLRASYAGTGLAVNETNTRTNVLSHEGVVTGSGGKARALADEFIAAIAQHRFWSRELKGGVPA